MTVAFWSGTREVARCGRASAPAARASASRSSASGTPASSIPWRFGDELGEHVEVRERDRVARAAPVDTKGEHEQHRDGEQREQDEGGAEAHPVAHLTPTWTYGLSAARKRLARDDRRAGRFPLTIVRFTLHRPTRAPGGGALVVR